MASRTFLIISLLGLVLLAASCVPGDPVANDVETVRVKGRTFFMEIAADDATRVRGLGGRELIEDDGGMLFVFPRPRVLGFVMRDCLVPIDIAFLDQFGVVVATHEMPIEPRQPGESASEYEGRLTVYSSRSAAQFALEFRAGMLRELGLERGDKVELDVARLQSIAR
ncbi:MAG: DUF192 domain-containing protein [Phycisphaeraceae bacterium]|nr:DUF192 domain-containing protein [Phycisphaeraceae bacterium]